MAVTGLPLKRLLFAGIIAAVTARAAFGGHELPVYPSYYPHEITIRTVPPDEAPQLLREGKIHAYVGEWRDSSDPAPPLRIVESLGSFVMLEVNPASSAAAASPCDAIAAVAGQLAGGGFVFHPYPVTPFHGDYLFHMDRAEMAKARLAGDPGTTAPAAIRIRADGPAAHLLGSGLSASG